MLFNMNTRRHLPSIETSGKYLQPLDASGDGQCRTSLPRSTGTSELSKERRLWRKVEQTIRVPSKFSLAKFTMLSCVIYSCPLIQTRLFRIPRYFELETISSTSFTIYLTIRLRARVFYEHIVNEAQPS